MMAKRTAVWVTCFCIAVAVVYPVFFIMSTAFRSREDYARNPIGLPFHPTLSNVVAALDAGVGGYAANTLFIVLVSVLVLVPIACCAGFALSCLTVPMRRTIMVLIIATMMVPAPVLMIPTFRVVWQMGLLDTRTGLILVYAGLNTAVSTYMMSSFFGRLPRELFEQASIDGAGAVRSFLQIALPLVRSAVITISVLNFFWLWNEFLFAQVLINSDIMKTLTVGLAAMQGEYVVDVSTMTGGLVIALLPPLIIFALSSRYLREGLVQGAFKG